MSDVHPRKHRLRAPGAHRAVGLRWLARGAFAAGFVVAFGLASEAHAAVGSCDAEWFFAHGSEGGRCGPSYGHLVFLAVIAAVVISVVRIRHATERRRLDVARRMVEHGQDVPTDLLGGPAWNDLRRGLVLLSTGVGLLLYSLIRHDGGEISPAGLIPGFIGVGYLLSHKLARRKVT